MSQFYLRDSRANVGDTCIFWAKDGCGYTSDLDKAEIYSLEDAQSHFNSRHSDIPLSKELVDGEARKRVDMQYLGDEGEKQGCDEYVIRVGTRYNGNDVYWLNYDLTSANYAGARVFCYQRALEIVAELAAKDIKAAIYPKPDIDAIARRTLQVGNIHERRMITAAGIRKPKRKRSRYTTGKTRGNCPHCGKVTWGMNPYEAYTCIDAYNERLGWQRFSNEYNTCEDVAKSRKRHQEAA